jgi:hypothetical protein
MKNPKHRNPKRGKASARLNFFLLSGVIIGLCIYMTAQSKWQPGVIAAIVMLLFPAGFYLWLWRTYFK